jgi:hypothetical protein
VPWAGHSQGTDALADEAHRLEGDAPQAWRDGTALLDWLELA